MRTLKHLYASLLVLVSVGCCPKPEGCLESTGTLRYQIDDNDSTGQACGWVDLAPGDVIAFKKIGEYHPPHAERQCAGCPLVEVTPAGDVSGWSQVEPRQPPPDRGPIASAFSASVDGCRVDVEVWIGPLSGEEARSDFQMYRRLVWNEGCSGHLGSCLDHFLMTELPPEE